MYPHCQVLQKGSLRTPSLSNWKGSLDYQLMNLNEKNKKPAQRQDFYPLYSSKMRLVCTPKIYDVTFHNKSHKKG